VVSRTKNWRKLACYNDCIQASTDNLSIWQSQGRIKNRKFERRVRERGKEKRETEWGSGREERRKKLRERERERERERKKERVEK
jgi:hypothetical protein